MPDVTIRSEITTMRPRGTQPNRKMQALEVKLKSDTSFDRGLDPRMLKPTKKGPKMAVSAA